MPIPIFRPATPAIVMLLAALAGVVAFQLMFGLPLVRAADPYWIEPRGDMAIMMTGHLALLQDAWRFPLTVTDRLRAPELISIVYTDSLPWLTLLMKATGLARHLNLLGLFLLISYALQPVAMIALLRACGAQRLTTLAAGAALALLVPAWLARQFGHLALGAHWLLLFALALSIASSRFGLTRWRIAGFTALAALAVGVHAYHLPPIAVCFGAALASELLQRRPGGWARAAIAAVAVGGAVGLSAWVLGYGIGQGINAGGATMGLWSMNALAPVWPQASALFGQDWDGGWFKGTLDPTGGQAFEGYNYLGAGVLLLTLAGVALTVWRRTPGSQAPSPWGLLARFGPLAAGLLALTLWAVGPKAYVGTALVLDLGPPPGWLGEAMGLFRAHGRFFWTAGYALLAFGLVQADRRLGARAGAALCLLAVGLQAYDVNQMQRGVRTAYEPWPTFYDEARQFRSSPAFAGRTWRIFPPPECTGGKQGLTGVQLSHLAVRRGGASTATGTARNQTSVCDVYLPDALETARPGDQRLTVLLVQPGQPHSDPARFARRADCYVFSRGLICGRGLEREGLTPRP